MGRLGRTVLIGAVASGLVFASACGGDDGDGGGPTTTAATPAPGLDEIQLLASHNSTHIQGPQPLLDAITDALPELTPTIEYTHAPLAEQLDLGVRSFELDVYDDPDGGRYAAPKAVELLGLPATDPALAEPGFKVFHIQEIDYLSTCPTLAGCLTELRAWSDAHPDHLPIVIQIEVKDGEIPDPLELSFVQPIPATAETFTALDEQIRAVLPDERLVLPGDVQGDHDTLRAAVEADGWPSVDDLRGRFVFALDDRGAKRDLYRALHPDTRDRLLFVDAQPPEDDAAYTVLNDPIGDGDLIRDLVAKGFLVRTRADADTVEARTGDTAPREAAFASGAQIISTDYEQEDPRFPGYVVDLPGDGAARCNPVSGGDCDEAALRE